LPESEKLADSPQKIILWRKNLKLILIQVILIGSVFYLTKIDVSGN
jgi:hypothetical protein